MVNDMFRSAPIPRWRVALIHAAFWIAFASTMYAGASITIWIFNHVTVVIS